MRVVVAGGSGFIGSALCKALLEAGHVGQNALLAAWSLGLAAVPVGGVYEGRVEELLGADGVDESLVYALSVGRRAAP